MEYGPRALNPLYYDVLAAFERESGLPALVNTSFNVHEEPIVNKPAECARAAGWADRFHRDNAGNLPADPWSSAAWDSVNRFPGNRRRTTSVNFCRSCGCGTDGRHVALGCSEPEVRTGRAAKRGAQSSQWSSAVPSASRMRRMAEIKPSTSELCSRACKAETSSSGRSHQRSLII